MIILGSNSRKPSNQSYAPL